MEEREAEHLLVLAAGRGQHCRWAHGRQELLGVIELLDAFKHVSCIFDGLLGIWGVPQGALKM